MKVLIINPGATSTKIAVFDEDTQVFKKGIDHSAQELDRFDRVVAACTALFPPLVMPSAMR